MSATAEGTAQGAAQRTAQGTKAQGKAQDATQGEARSEAPSNGRVPRYTKEQIIAALQAAGGIQHIAAQKLGCARSTLTYYKQHVPGIAEAIDEITESLIDLSEGVVLFHVRKKNLRAAQFVLETKGKARGWVKRGEITGPDGAPIDVRLGLDLSKLTPDELDQLDQILERADARAAGVTPEACFQHDARAAQAGRRPAQSSQPPDDGTPR